MAKAADVVVQCLENEGVEYVFGIPGEENLDLLESLRKSKIKLVLTRHEQSAGFMAATYGRLTGKTGVSLSTLGPGATNLVTASAYAYLGGMPMMMITGQKPIKKSKQGRFQIIDVCGMMDPITKYTHQFASADNIPARMREAFRLAEEEKPGAVHLELPEDIAAEQTDALPIPRSLHRRPLAEHVAIEAAVEKLQNARNPILVIGAGANRKMTGRMLRQLIDKTGFPFVTTQMGKGVIDERHPQLEGMPHADAVREGQDVVGQVGATRRLVHREQVQAQHHRRHAVRRGRTGHRLCDAVALALRGSPGPAGGLSYSGWSLQDNCTVHISTADARHRSDSLVLAIVEAYR